MKYYVITPVGAASGVVQFIPAKKRPSLEELQGIVGGLIEFVRVKGGNLWVNEEGLLQGLPLNYHASVLANQPIVGTVLACMRKPRGEAE